MTGRDPVPITHPHAAHSPPGTRVMQEKGAPGACVGDVYCESLVTYAEPTYSCTAANDEELGFLFSLLFTFHVASFITLFHIHAKINF